MLAWASALGSIAAFGVEGTGSYGVGLTRFLRRHGRKVIEVSRSPRAGQRRLSGKSDVIDAEHAARQVLAGTASAVPKLADGQVEAIRLLKVVRDTAVKAQKTAMITLKATLVNADDELRSMMRPLTDHKLIVACAALDTDGAMSDPAVAMRHALAAFARRWLDLHEEIKSRTPPQMLEAFGVGFDTAAEMLITAGDNTDRVRNERAFAKLCGVCPIPAGSGRTNGRHRLNRGGNRQANPALYRTVIVRMHWHPQTIAYVQLRTAEGLSNKEIIRCLKRYVTRELYALLPAASTEEHLALVA